MQKLPKNVSSTSNDEAKNNFNSSIEIGSNRDNYPPDTPMDICCPDCEEKYHPWYEGTSDELIYQEETGFRCPYCGWQEKDFE